MQHLALNNKTQQATYNNIIVTFKMIDCWLGCTYHSERQHLRYVHSHDIQNQMKNTAVADFHTPGRSRHPTKLVCLGLVQSKLHHMPGWHHQTPADDRQHVHLVGSSCHHTLFPIALCRRFQHGLHRWNCHPPTGLSDHQLTIYAYFSQSITTLCTSCFIYHKNLINTIHTKYDSFTSHVTTTVFLS